MSWTLEMLRISFLVGVFGSTFFVVYLLYNFSSDSTPSYSVVENISKKHIPCNTSSSNCTTIVTAFFLFSKSKHNISHYEAWMSNFLSTINTPITIFTQPSLIPMINELRQDKATHFLIYDQVWDLPWIQERQLNTTYRQMQEKDPEKHIHSPELYAIWNSKLWMLDHVAELENVFSSTFFYWMDIGSIRHGDHKLEYFPYVQRSIQVFGDSQSSKNYTKFNVFGVNSFKDYKPPPDTNTFEEMRRDFVIGGFFGGTVFSIHWFAREFYSLHDDFMERGYFVGKDQILYNWMATQYPNDILIVCVCQEVNGGCGDPWFYFQQWYSSMAESVGDEGKCRNAPVKDMKNFMLEMRQSLITTTAPLTTNSMSK